MTQPAVPAGTGSTTTKVLGALVLLGIAAVVFLAFSVSGPDTELGETVRLLYVHVPSAIMAYLACTVTTVGSVMYLWKKSEWWDLVAASSAEIGAVFAALTLVTGMIWGRPTWGVFWVWDARLTSMSMLLLLLLGYLAIRRVPSDAGTRSKRAAVVGLLLLPNVMIVNRSVEWWRTLHQKTTFVSLDPKIDGWQLFTWATSMLVFALFFLWLVIHRFRVAWLQDQIDQHGLDRAIAERRAEADPPATTAEKVAP